MKLSSRKGSLCFTPGKPSKSYMDGRMETQHETAMDGRARPFSSQIFGEVESAKVHLKKNSRFKRGCLLI